ncbi:MAG: hypothetical protein CL476_06490 [Acidobacteria bacterium]|nr:hypothetical protein [Acidobacteriota bacterium]
MRGSGRCPPSAKSDCPRSPRHCRTRWTSHEGLDGSGYHRGLRGEQLSRDARILAALQKETGSEIPPRLHRGARPGTGLSRLQPSRRSEPGRPRQPPRSRDYRPLTATAPA